MARMEPPAEITMNWRKIIKDVVKGTLTYKAGYEPEDVWNQACAQIWLTMDTLGLHDWKRHGKTVIKQKELLRILLQELPDAYQEELRDLSKSEEFDDLEDAYIVVERTLDEMWVRGRSVWEARKRLHVLKEQPVKPKGKCRLQ